MDVKVRWVDNVFIERLWRSVKYEEVYLKGYDSVAIARRELAEYFDFYNRRLRLKVSMTDALTKYIGIYCRAKKQHKKGSGAPLINPDRLSVKPGHRWRRAKRNLVSDFGLVTDMPRVERKQNISNYLGNLIISHK